MIDTINAGYEVFSAWFHRGGDAVILGLFFIVAAYIWGYQTGKEARK